MLEIEQSALAQLELLKKDGYLLNDSKFVRLNGWTHLMILLDESRRCLDLSKKYNSLPALEPHEQITVAHALFRTAIICYGKCYAQAGQGRITLDKNKVFREHKNLRAVHDHMVNIRNSFVAHNNENNIDVAIVATKESDKEILVKYTYTLSTPLNEYDQYLSVISHCSDYLILAINKYLDRLEKDLGKEILMG